MENTTQMRKLAMRQFLAPLAVCTLLFGGCAAAQPAADRGRPVTTGTAAPNPAPGAASSSSTVSPLPSRPPTQQMAPPSVSEGQIGAAPNPGGITGYGPGGMARMPGSLPNPPYH
jgi:hypothetical protein